MKTLTIGSLLQSESTCEYIVNWKESVICIIAYKKEEENYGKEELYKSDAWWTTNKY